MRGTRLIASLAFVALAVSNVCAQTWRVPTNWFYHDPPTGITGSDDPAYLDPNTGIICDETFDGHENQGGAVSATHLVSFRLANLYQRQIARDGQVCVNIRDLGKLALTPPCSGCNPIEAPELMVYGVDALPVGDTDSVLRDVSNFNRYRHPFFTNAKAATATFNPPMRKWTQNFAHKLKELYETQALGSHRRPEHLSVLRLD